MIIPEVAPMLTCTATNDGYLYELVLRAREGLPAITKVRFGPYYFKPEHQPTPLILGFSKGGPEQTFWLHKTTPPGWSRFHWEIDRSESNPATYLVAVGGDIAPGTQGVFRFVSFYAPWGLRIGLEVYRNNEHIDCGVCGPNYEEFLRGDHEH